MLAQEGARLVGEQGVHEHVLFALGQIANLFGDLVIGGGDQARRRHVVGQHLRIARDLLHDLGVDAPRGLAVVAADVVLHLLGHDAPALAGEHVETEAALKASGITYTILRNGWYTENYTASIPAALANNAFYGSAKNGKISSVLRAELAEAAVNVALSEGHENQTYELAGSTSWTLADLAAEISKQTGKDIPYVDIPAADYAAALVQAGLDEGFAGLIAQWDVDASNGALFSEDKTLEKLLGRPTAGLDVAVKQALAH